MISPITTVPFALKKKRFAELRNDVYHKILNIVPGSEKHHLDQFGQLATLARNILTGKGLTQIIFLLLNEVLLTDIVYELIANPFTDTVYQFPPAINLRGFTTLEELETYDRCTYNIQTGEQHPPEYNLERTTPRRLLMTEIMIPNDANTNNTLG